MKRALVLETSFMSAWVCSAVNELLGLAETGGGWPYRKGSVPAVEPSALAGLALLSVSDTPPECHRRAAARAADRIAGAQRPDGAIGVSLSQPEPGWATPFGVLLWKALGVHGGRVDKACEWLRSARGEALPLSDDPERVVGHDTTLVGWPWVPRTHSWLEPTAAALLALDRCGHGTDRRVSEGVALVRDRAVATGGWNFGNKAVFGRPLRPQPGPTGLALLALAGHGPGGEVEDQARAYLSVTLPGLRASASLGWGLLGLRAWGDRPDGSDDWLAASYRAAAGRPDAPVKLALLLLAAGPSGPRIFGKTGPDILSRTHS